MADKVSLIGINAYAKHRGVTRRAVQENIAKGKIPCVIKDGKRWIDPVKADAAWAANIVPSKSVYETFGAKTGPKASSDGHDPRVPNIHVQEAYMKAYRARLVKLELDERQGKLIEKAKVYNQTFTAVRIVKDALLNIPQKLAPELAAEVDPHKCELLLMDEIHNCLMELSELAERFK